MSFTYRPAKREQVNVLIALAGASGSGKTMSALRLAHGLSSGQPFAAIDTESGRMLHYADGYGFKFEYGALAAPYSPDHYLEAITAAEAAGYPVIVIDSFTHEWDGVGGCVDMQEDEVDRLSGGDDRRRDAVKIAAWVKPKQEHRRLMARLLQCRAHLIFCLRADNGKVEIQRGMNGKTEVVPKRVLGWASEWIPITEKRFIYEMTTSFVLSPDKPGYPIPIKLQDQHKAFFPLDQQISEAAGRQLAAWAKGSTTASGPAPSPSAVPASNPGATSGGGPGGDPPLTHEEITAYEYRDKFDGAKTGTEGKGWSEQWDKVRLALSPALQAVGDAARERARARLKPKARG